MAYKGCPGCEKVFEIRSGRNEARDLEVAELHQRNLDHDGELVPQNGRSSKSPPKASKKKAKGRGAK